jgi:hypothetical protein
MKDIPKIKIGKYEVSRLIIGGNPIAGFSHQSDELNWEMRKYYTMSNVQKLLKECLKNGINTVQFRGDRFFMRAILEHYEAGGNIQWICQTASELKDIKANIKEIIKYKPIAIYHHGTDVDNKWHEGKIDEVKDIVKFIKDNNMLAGIGSHNPEVIEYAEEKGWETDFYMCCFYNLARKFKPYQAVITTNVEEEYLKDDPDKMTATMRLIRKPCLGFKILAAGRNCNTFDEVKKSFEYAFENIKPSDAVVVGVFQKYKNQIKENSQIVREILLKKNS